MPRPDSNRIDWWWTEHGGAPRWVLILAGLVPIAFAGFIVFSLFSSGTGDAAPAAPPAATDPSASAGPAASASPSSNPPTDPSTAVFIGDSYAVGVGSSSPAARWTTLLSAQMGWNEVNLAATGTGYRTSVDDPTASICGSTHCPNYSEVIPAAVAVAPEVVIVSGGRNDVRTDLTRNAVVRDGIITTRAVRDAISRLRTALPDARIYVVSPIWDDDQPPAELTTVRESVRSAAVENGATYIDIGEPLEGRTDLIAPDGIHPNDAGAKVVADAVGGAIGTP